ALSVSIGQSSYINIYPRRRIEETLRRMEKQNISRIDETIAREIAVREGINIMVVPGISRVGDSYVLTGILTDSRDGKILASELVRAKSSHKILASLDKLSKKIRRDLGESLSAIQERSKPLTQVTTSSLEALKQYSLGTEAHWKANLQDARLYYENALKIDTTFTAAKASLGMLEYERFDREKGKQLIVEAIKNIDSLTEKERLGILAFYANAVEHNLDKAANYTKSIIAIYPDHYPAYNNLGWYYQQMGRYGDAIVAYKKALQFNPYLIFTYNGLNWIYLNESGEVDSAIVWCKKQISYAPDNPWGYDYLGWAYLGKDSLLQAEEAFKKALELNPSFILDLYRLAHTYRLQGRYEEAIEPLKKILQIDSTEFSAHYNLGLIYSHLNLPKLSRRHYEIFRSYIEKQVRENPEDISNQFPLAVILTRLGEKERGRRIARKAIQTDSTEHFGCALYYSVTGEKQKAIHHLKLDVENGDHNYIWFKIHPDFEPLYAEAEFREIIREGLKQ
ncbi:MAG: tetratricopeptide repeat protein, partial [Calditrichia bacterium]